MQVDETIFKAYDIRGLYPTEINEEVAKAIGKALGTLLVRQSKKNVVVGRDNRPSSQTICGSFIYGLCSAGCDVTYVGMVVQPAIHFFSFDTAFDAAVNITASHNPKEFNGIKIEFSDAQPLYGDELKKLNDLILAEDFEVGAGKYKEVDLNNGYIDYISKSMTLKKRIKMVVYCGNGVTSLAFPSILQKIGVDLIELECELDSNFPKGVPDPEKGNFVSELSKAVIENKADFGVGFDGDGDRVGVVDELGQYYKSDELLILFAKDLLSRHKGATIIYDVKSSQLVDQLVRKYGGIL